MVELPHQIIFCKYVTNITTCILVIYVCIYHSKNNTVGAQISFVLGFVVGVLIDIH